MSSSQERAQYKFISNSDRYDPDRLAYEQELLRDFYLSQGYADFQILSAVAELSDDKDNFFITISVDEGKRYKFGKVDLYSQIRNFDHEVLRESISHESGDWYDADQVKLTVDQMTEQLGDLQFAFVDIQPDIQKNRQDLVIDITNVINETPLVFVERINVNGNIRTLDKVLRRAMSLVECDTFNRSKLETSQIQFKNLDILEGANVYTSQGSVTDEPIVDIHLQ